MQQICRGLGLILLGFLASACAADVISIRTDRAVPQPAQVQPPQAAVATTAPVVESTPTPQPAETNNDQADGSQPDVTAEATVAETPVPDTPVIRSFQEFLPDPAAIEARYDDGGLWALVDIKYLEPGPRLGIPCGATEPPDFDGIEAIYTNISGENLLVMVQRGEGVNIWLQGIAEGVECTELGIRQSALTVPGTDQSVVLEINPDAPAASMAITGALLDDIFISFVAGAVSAESPVADPNAIVDLTAAMFDRINQELAGEE